MSTPVERVGIYSILVNLFLLTIAVVTLSHHKLQEKEGRWFKLISGVVMLSLGVILIVTPGWLTT